MADIEQVLGRLKGVTKDGPRHWMAFCPAHENVKTQALSVSEAENGKILLKCFGADCSFESIVGALGMAASDFMGRSEIAPIREVVNLEALARKTGLPVEFLGKIGWKDTKSGTAVAVCYRDTEGAFAYSKLRVSIGGNPKYKFPAGTKQIAYGLQFLRRWRQNGSTRLFLVEGETDAATLWSQRIPALGIPGSGAVNGTLRPIYLKGFQEVVAVQENDDAGSQFVQRVADLCIAEGVAAQVKVLKLPEGVKDTNDLYREDPDGFALAFNNLAHEAEAWRDTKNTQWLIPLSSLSAEEKQPEFLWDPYLPEGELCLMAGKPGIGKSLCTMALGALLTRGWKLPGGSGMAPKKTSTLYLAGEDDPQRVLIPRARKHNADLERLFVIDREQWPIDLWQEECIDDLASRAKAAGIGLIIIDPIQAWVSEPKFSMNSATDVRRVMSGLKRLCQKANLTTITVAHDRKGEVASAIDAVLGSRDFTAAVRSVLMLFEHPMKKGYGILTHAKHNYSKAGPSLEYRVDDTDGRPSLVWSETPSELTAEDLVMEKQTGHDKTAAEDAEAILRELFLGTDRIEADVAVKEAKKQGISPWTMRRARKLLGYGLRKIGSKWYWLRVEREPGEESKQESSGVPF